MKKRVFIIHGWGGSPNGDWFVWLKKELEKIGYKVEIPEMPDSFHPKINAWIYKLKESVGDVDENTYFVGHSIGSQAIMRYLEKLPKDKKVGGVVFVAGWFNLTEETWDENYTKEIAYPWLKNPINFDSIKRHTNSFVAILSDNDPYVPLSDAELFKNRLDARVIIQKGKGHFSGEEGITKLPIILKSLLSVIKND